MAGPTQYVSGIISTLNWDQVIEALLSRERAYVYSLEDRISENLTKLTAWGSINAGLVTLQNYLTILSQSSTFQATSGTSDKQDILTATVSEAGQPGLYPLKVYQLSQTHQLISRGFADTESEIASINDTITMEVGGGWIDKKTPLSWLNGQSGIYRGSIKITDRSGSSATIDLNGALTIEDVLDTINENTTIKVTAEIEYDAGNKVGDALKLTDTSGGSNNFIVEEIDGGRTAENLGILDNVAGTEIHGDDINYITSSTNLDLLNDGTGVNTITGDDFTITCRNGTTIDVDVSSCTTVGDVIDAINDDTDNSGKITASIVSGANGITLTDNTGGGGDLFVTDIGSSTATAGLGIEKTVSGSNILDGDAIIAGLNTVLLKTVNGGSGVGSVTGDDFQVQMRSGSTFNVDISGDETLQEVINSINTATGNTNITASHDREGHALLLTDTSTGSNDLAVTVLNSSSAASHLGILKSVAASTLEGDDLNPQYISYSTQLEDLNGGQGVNANKIKITDRSQASAGIDLSNAETIAEVINAINAASGIDVTASINSQGNGILITDNTGQSDGPLKIEEAGGTTARDLNILESTNSTTIDGSFEVTVQLSSEDTTLAGIRDAINAADAGVSAAIINDGSSFNPYRLLITSEKSGEVGRMMVDAEFSAGEVLELNTSISAKNAIVVLQAEEGGNILITDTSNQLDQVIPGVTINLLSADPAETVSVKVEADIAAVQQSIINLTSTYNNLMDAINSQQSYNADIEQRGGPLFGNVSLMNIRNQLRRVITDPIESSASLTSIFDLGISADLTGHLNVDSSRLTEVLKDDLEGVKDFFSLSENVAHSSFETTPSASSALSGDFNVESVNNGDTSSDNWGSPGGGWMDGTQSTFPDYLTLTFDTIRTLHKVTIHTLDSDTDPASSYGIKDYELQYLTRGGNPDNDDDWQTHTTITDNSEGTITHYLSSISTQAIRLKINNSNDGQYSRIIEFEAYQRTGIAGALKNYLNNITTADTGLIACVEDSLYSQNEDYQGRIEAQEKLMEMKEEKLVRDFVQMEQYLAVMQVQSSWLQQQMSILSSLAGSQ